MYYYYAFLSPQRFNFFNKLYYYYYIVRLTVLISNN